MKRVPHPHDADTSVTAAPATITTTDGVLKLEEHGLFNTKSLEFAGIATVTGGTGKFEGYSGRLMALGYAKGKAVFMGTLTTVRQISGVCAGTLELAWLS
jgi:hypothetical protein